MSKDELAEGVAAKVKNLLQVEKRNVSWLASETGIPYNTLRNQLTRNPRTLSVAHAILIAAAFDVQLSELAPEAVAA